MAYQPRRAPERVAVMSTDTSIVEIGHPRHLMGEDALAMVHDRYGRGEAEITDACAVTIASWWQGPREGDGLAFAELASSGHLDSERLSDDIANVYALPSTPAEDRIALDMLRDSQKDGRQATIKVLHKTRAPKNPPLRC